MIFLLGNSGCAIKKIVCAQVKSYEMKPLVLCDVSFQFNRCRCRCFDPNTWQSLPLNQCKEFEGAQGDAIRYAINHCEGLVGFFDVDIATEIKPKVNALNGVKKDYCE